MVLPSKHLRDLIVRNARRKPATQNHDTHRVNVNVDIHACNTCGGWETKSETWREQFPIIHETWCKFYPSLANIELEAQLEQSGHWHLSKWDPRPRFVGKNEYQEAVARTKAAVADAKRKGKEFWANLLKKGAANGRI